MDYDRDVVLALLTDWAKDAIPKLVEGGVIEALAMDVPPDGFRTSEEVERLDLQVQEIVHSRVGTWDDMGRRGRGAHIHQFRYNLTVPKFRYFAAVVRGEKEGVVNVRVLLRNLTRDLLTLLTR